MFYCFISKCFYCFGQILFNLELAVQHEKSFVPAFFKGYIGHLLLFDNLEKLLFWKKVRKKS